MHVTPLKTPIITAGDDLLAHIAAALAQLQERSVLVVTSKVVALWERAVVENTSLPEQKAVLVRQQSEWYTEPTSSRYGVQLTIRDQMLGVNAGIDESNVASGFVLLPHDPFASATRIWQFLRKQYSLDEVGVIISDSMSLPLTWGVIGRSIAHCGFMALTNRIGEADLFGRPLKMTQMAVAQGLAAAAVVQMGEAAEATPLCLLEDIKHIQFTDHPPTDQERAALAIATADDVYAPLLLNAPWKPGERKKAHG